MKKIAAGDEVDQSVAESLEGLTAEDLDVFNEEESEMVFDDQDIEDSERVDDIDFSDIDPDFLLEDIDEEGLV